MIEKASALDAKEIEARQKQANVFIKLSKGIFAFCNLRANHHSQNDYECRIGSGDFQQQLRLYSGSNRYFLDPPGGRKIVMLFVDHQ
jgi:hypothetical protein